MFNPKLCKVIIESSLIDLKKEQKIKVAMYVTIICFNSKIAFGILG